MGLRNVAVHYIGSCVPAFEWARDVIDPLVGKTVMVLPASPVIGVHVGPAMGLAYECAAPIEGQVRNFARDHCFVAALTPVLQGDRFGTNLRVRSVHFGAIGSVLQSRHKPHSMPSGR